jgi:hypothetical protein
MTTLNIEELTERKTFQIIHDEDKEYIKFKIKDYNKMTDQIIDEKLRLLKTINTFNAQKWVAVLELAKVNGWLGLTNSGGLIELKDKLKLRYSRSSEDFAVYLNDIEVYRPITNIKIDGIEEEIECDDPIISYKEAKKRLLDMLEPIYTKIDEYKFKTDVYYILSGLSRTYAKFVKFDFMTLSKILGDNYAIISDEGSAYLNKNFIKIDVDKFIEEMNKIKDDDNVIMQLEYNSEEVLRQIAERYNEIKNKALRFFFQTIKEKSFGEAILLTYINFQNVCFYAGYYSDYPQKFKDGIYKVFRSLKKYELGRAINNLKNNRFEDVVVDDDGNILEIDPIQERFDFKFIIEFQGTKIILK